MDYQDITAFTEFFASYNIQNALHQNLIDAKQKMGEKARANSSKKAKEERKNYFKNFKDDVQKRIESLKKMRDLLEKFSGFIDSHLMHDITFSIDASIQTLEGIDADFNKIISSKDNKGMVPLVQRLNTDISTFSDQTSKMNDYMEQLQKVYVDKLSDWLKSGSMTIEEAKDLLQNETLTDEQKAAIDEIIKAAEKEKGKAEEDQEKESEQASIDEDNKGKRNIGPASAPASHKTRKQIKAEQQVKDQNRKARQKDNMPKELQQQLEKFAKEYVPKEGESYAEAVQKIILDYQIEQLEKEVQQLSADVEEIKKSGKKVPIPQIARLQSLHLQIETLKSDEYDLNLGKRAQKHDERMAQNQQQLDSLQQRLAQNQPKTSALSRYISAARGKHLERLITELQSRQLVVATQQYCMVNAKYNTAARKVERASTIQANREVIMERAQERIKQLQVLRTKVADEAVRVYNDYGRRVVDSSVGAATYMAGSASKIIKRGVSHLEEVLPALRQAASVGFIGAAPMTSEQLYEYATEGQKQR